MQSEGNRIDRLYRLICLGAMALIVLGTSGCSGGSGDGDTGTAAHSEDSNDQSSLTPYVFANGCYAIQSQASGQFVAATSTSYAATGRDMANSLSFFMKPSTLGIYLLLDAEGWYLDVDQDGRIIRGTQPTESAQWEVLHQADDVFTLRSLTRGRWLAIDGTESAGLSLKVSRDAQCAFTFRTAQGCQAFPESEVNAAVAVSKPPVGTPIVGFADAHCHIVASEGFGGKVVWGKAFHPLGITKALPDCRELHGDHGSRDIIGAVANGNFGHDTSGWPDFKEWPGPDMPTHQTVYYRWLERAYLGGLQLIVCFAVSNEVLCQIAGQAPGYSCDDMETVDRQLGHVRQMEAYIDAQCGGPGKGWFRIVTTPAQARKVISEGKLAVILGIEVATIFGAATDDPAQMAFLRKQLDAYYDKGVRSIFPIHGFNNGFGGTAMFVPLIYNLGNRIIRGQYIEPCECPKAGDPSLPADETLTQREIFAYKEPSLSYADDPLLALLAPAVGWMLPFYPASLGSHCNSRGLTDLGDYFIREMMKKKLILEVDHMCSKMLNSVLDIAEEYDYPVVSSHTSVVEGKGDEAAKSIKQLERIRNLGGISAPILIQGNGSGTIADPPIPGTDCKISSKSWAQVYVYVSRIMQQGTTFTGVPLSTDFNGFATMPSPRFGPKGCSGNEEQCAGQENPVVYPFAAHAGQGEFQRLTTGNRVFDINTDGVANYGLLPDFIQDLKQVGLTDRDLEPLFNSAEAYIRMWERIESKK